MELPFQHTIRFTNEGAIGLSDLGQTLIAHEIAFSLLPKILERIFPGLIVNRFAYELALLSRNSPAQEEFIGKLFVNVQETVEEYIKSLADRVGFDFMKTHSHGLSLVVIAMFLIGGLWAWSRLNPATPANVHVQGDNNVVVNLTAESLGITGDDLRVIFDDALSAHQKRQLERASANVFAPSKSEIGATVEVPGVYRVSPETAAAIPTPEMLEDADPLEEYETINDAQINVRATNLDDREHGWAGLIKISGRIWRVRILWPSDVPLDFVKRMSDDSPIVADVIIIYRPNRTGEFVPKIASVQRVHSPGT
ncbi:MAG: hypothetical protein H6852_18635 [Geminicoccaceae bacterium]|nr:hypothetical protein [Geminicoccaceae bacterium]